MRSKTHISSSDDGCLGSQAVCGILYIFGEVGAFLEVHPSFGPQTQAQFLFGFSSVYNRGQLLGGTVTLLQTDSQYTKAHSYSILDGCGPRTDL